MGKLSPPVSVYFSCDALMVLDRLYGPKRIPPGGDYQTLLEHLGRAEAVYRSLPGTEEWPAEGQGVPDFEGSSEVVTQHGVVKRATAQHVDCPCSEYDEEHYREPRPQWCVDRDYMECRGEKPPLDPVEAMNEHESEHVDLEEPEDPDVHPAHPDHHRQPDDMDLYRGD